MQIRATYPETAALDLSVVVPTFNESGNIAELIERLDGVLTGLRYEIVFVDDDSPDGTAELVAAFARRDPRVRLVHRVGRRGLSSACIEGILTSTASFVAVMDADMQHDESILASMVERLRSDSLDLVVGTRNSDGGSMGDFSRHRVAISRFAQRLSQTVCHCPLTDPMSGFFVLRRSFFLEVVRRLHGGGFKILVDILSSADRPVRFAEIGYTFRTRRHGCSKLDVNVAIEYFYLVIDKLTGRLIPSRFVAFSLVGAAGVLTHLLFVYFFLFSLHWRFATAQIVATYIAMTENFFLNNVITWRDRSLRGWRIVSGLVSYFVACSFGAWASMIFARALRQGGSSWLLAGGAGILLSSVWNYSMTNLFTWQRPQCRPLAEEHAPAEESVLDS
jgi:dolichol-phosphate mannosyltransferase